MAANQLESDTGSAEETHWIPLSDLMTGLMVMFLLIAVTYMIRVEADADRVKEVAIAYSEIKDALYDDLNLEFKGDLQNWKAQLIKDDLSIRFTEPEVLFAEGSSDLKPNFERSCATSFRGMFASSLPQSIGRPSARFASKATHHPIGPA